jgi:hypothetical protein
MHPLPSRRSSRFALLALCVGVSALPSAEKPLKEDPPGGIRMFVCAHSFHIFVGKYLDALAKSEKIDEHKLVGVQMIGGSRVIQHWNLPDDKNKAKLALRTGKVDVLTLSPHLAIPDEGIDRFAELALKHNPKARIFVQMSWYPFDSLVKGEKIVKNDQRDSKTIAQLRPQLETWKKQLEAQVKKINDKLDRPAVFIVPVGDAVLRLRELVIEGKVPGIKKQSELFTDPIGHARLPVMMLATYCHYVAIYKSKPTTLPGYVKPGDKEQEALYRLLQNIAWETVTKYPPAGVRSKGKKGRSFP